MVPSHGRLRQRKTAFTLQQQICSESEKERNSAGGRSAGRLRYEQQGGRSAGLQVRDPAISLLCDDRPGPWLRTSPMRCGYGSATVMVAARGVAQDRFIKRTAQGIAAVMGTIAATASVRRRSRSLQRDRNKRSEKREQQQKSGSQPLHAFPVNQNPEWVEHKTESWEWQGLRVRRQNFYIRRLKVKTSRRGLPHSMNPS